MARLRWSSSPGSLWLWLPLSAVFARHTLVAFQCVSDIPREYEAVTTLSPMPGQAALRGVSGCSPRKALPGPSASAPSTSSSSCRSVPLRVYHRRSERHTQTGKTQDICIYYFSFFTIETSGCARGCCAGLRRRAVVACWRSAWGAQSLQDTSCNFAHYFVGFRSVAPCCPCCFDLGTLEQARGPLLFAFGRRFCEFATTLFHFWQFHIHC